MNQQIFIWGSIARASSNYHPEGGLVIIANDKEEALSMIDDDPYIVVTEEEWLQVETFPTRSSMSHIWVFPDAGCC